MTGRVQGKSIIVTGAGSGMGRAIAHRLAAEGASITVADLDSASAQAVVEEIRVEGGIAVPAQADVSERQGVIAMVDIAVSAFGRLDVIFNNAGFNKPMHLLDVTEENWRSIMDVNALGVLICTQEAARQMIRQGGGGKIVNTASIAGRQGYPSFAPYCASKFAVIALTQATARALAEHNITANAFAPGVVATPLWERLDKDLLGLGDSKEPGQAMADFSADILRGRPAQAADITGTALYLASEDSDYMTGQVMMIDGGMVLV
jgi:meso-butanediol dehydrogenase/(S,S)-butanediol dehydrogenase/diacetyl reductase